MIPASQKGKMSKSLQINHIHIVFLDVEKAFDKAWREGILHVMHEQGCRDDLWMYLDVLNEGISVRVKSAWGLTNPVKSDKVIKQGSVLSPIQYGLLIDQIAKELTKEKKGPKEKKILNF